MPEPEQKRKYTSILVPQSFLCDLQYYRGPERISYWRFLNRLINNYRKLQLQNAEFWARTMGQPSIREVMNERIPALPEAPTT